jgi:class 3 adenylate cyclase
MKCPACQTENSTGQRFCGQCGARLAVACAACGAANDSGHKFCGQCGAPLAAVVATPKFGSPESYTPRHLAEKILTSKAALEGERKQVTVLFADLKGSMELLADRDPEEARKLLDPVLEHMIEAVSPLRGHRQPGHGRRDHGAFWGAGGSRGPRGARQLRGAPDAGIGEALCRGRVSQFRSAHPDPRRPELGRGEVVVRAIGSDLHMDYTTVGQSTHLAARMEGRR